MNKATLGKKIIKILKITILLILMGIIAVISIDRFVVLTAEKYIYEENIDIEDLDCILVLGCAVWGGDTPSPMLADRLDKAIELYEAGVAPKIIVSGDHGDLYYDEVSVMWQYCIDAGVPSEDIFRDHAGFSTYESMYRAKAVFDVEKMVVVTQQYHLYRAVYSARALGVAAYGVSADDIEYTGQLYREVREILARVKDFAFVIIDVQPSFLGDTIPVSGDGNITAG